MVRQARTEARTAGKVWRRDKRREESDDGRRDKESRIKMKVDKRRENEMR